MNDATARALLAGIDAPRPLPAGFDAALATTLTESPVALGGVDAPRPLPLDLRHRLESTLTAATAQPVPRQVRRRIVTGIAGRRAPRIGLAAAAVVLVIGLVALVRPAGETRVETERPSALAPPSTTSAPVSAGSTQPGAAPSADASGTGDVPFAAPASGTTSAGSAASAPAPGAAADAAAPGDRHNDIVIAVVGHDTDVAAGFDAYLQTLNGSGGVNGRAVVTADGATGGAVATVNVGEAPLTGPVEGVVFETAFVEEARLRDLVVSLASPLERQARLAVGHAFPTDAPGARAAIYAGTTEPWATIVPAAFDDALRARGVTPALIPFTAGAPTFVPADAAFLSLSPAEVSSWVEAAPGPHDRGAWGVGSTWSDRLAPRAAALTLTALSPYAPVGGDEQAALLAGLGSDSRLSAAAVHGWVTAKAIAVALAANGGTAITAGDLDRLRGWDPGWAPPYEVRPGTRVRTPDAVALRSDASSFAPAGDFERDPS